MDFEALTFHPVAWGHDDLLDVTTQESLLMHMATATIRGVEDFLDQPTFGFTDGGAVLAILLRYDRVALCIDQFNHEAAWVPLAALTPRSSSEGQVTRLMSPDSIGDVTAAIRLIPHGWANMTEWYDRSMPANHQTNPPAPGGIVGAVDAMVCIRAMAEASIAIATDTTNLVQDAQDWADEAATAWESGLPPRVTFPPGFIAPDWTANHWDNWTQWAAEAGVIDTMIEVGTWEGRSAWAWAEGHFTGQRPVDVFTFDMGATSQSRGSRGRIQSMWSILEHHPQVSVIWGPSAHTLPHFRMALHDQGVEVDLVYIDGSHMADDVMLDSEFCWMMLREGGVMIWDDYESSWDVNDTYEALNPNVPARGVNAFLRLHDGEWEELRAPGPTAQRAIKKVAAQYNRWGSVARPLVFQPGFSQAVTYGLRNSALTSPLMPHQYDALQYLAARDAWRAAIAAPRHGGRLANAVVTLARAPGQAAEAMLQASSTATHAYVAHVQGDSGNAWGGFVGAVGIVIDSTYGAVGYANAVGRRFSQWLGM